MASRITHHLLVASGIFLTTFGAPLDAQKPIIVVDEKAAVCSKLDKSYGLPVEVKPYIVWTPQIGAFNFTELILQNDVWLHYNVPIGIGTNPSQLFNAIIDLQWADLWVVSQYCTEHRGCDYHLKYNASKSSTHEPNGTAMHLEFPIWPDVYGYISTDTVTLGESLKVEHHPFVELVQWKGYPREYDAALGLSPRQTLYGHADDSQPLLPSPFMGLMESKQLEKNSFALLLPYNRQDIGDLSFGTSHPEFHEGSFTSHPIYPENASTWQIEAPSISMRHHNGTEIFKYSFTGVSAQLDSILPYAAAWVPNELVQAVLNATNATVDETDCNLPVVPCDKISELPHLVFDFDGQEIVLNGEDYIGEAEWLFCFRGPYCSPLIGYGPGDDNTIVLGSPFLKKVYSVFDWDDRTVSFAMAKHRFLRGLSCPADVIPSFKTPPGFRPKVGR